VPQLPAIQLFVPFAAAPNLQRCVAFTGLRLDLHNLHNWPINVEFHV